MAVSCGMMLGFLNVGLVAQSADIFEPGKSAGSAEETSESKEKLPPPGPVDSQPSRFAGQDIEPYVVARAAVFSMRNRATDPFGMYQDPNMKPVVRKPVSNLPSKLQAALPPTPLIDIVSQIRVTTIMPGEKKFLVGIRSFSEGEEFPLVYEDKTLRMKVLEVTARRIVFRDIAKGENATLETGMLPPGMIAGGIEMRPPGMLETGDNMPLNLDSGRTGLPTE